MVINFNVKNSSIRNTTPTLFIATYSRQIDKASFDFVSSEWVAPIYATFKSSTGETYTVEIGTDEGCENNECIIPWEVLVEEGDVAVSCYCGNLRTSTSAFFSVRQSGYEEGETPTTPSGTVQQKLLEWLEEIKQDGYVKDEDYVHTDNNFTDDYKGLLIDASVKKHEHGNKGLLDNISASDIDNWNNKSNFSGDYDDLINKPDIPDDLADLNSDVAHRLVTDNEKETWNNKSDFSGDYSDLLNKPSKVSAFENDEGYVTNLVNDLANYYLKSETYTKDEVAQLLTTIKQFRYEAVTELPTASADTINKIYLIPSETQVEQNVKDEFITIENDGAYAWEQIGSTAIDLSDYVKNTDYASKNVAGVIKCGNGLSISSSGILAVYGVDTNNVGGRNTVKAGSINNTPITPCNQHYSVFYGLAKAAGDTTQAVSDNAIGVYTDEAKAAIQSMLGIDDLIGDVETALTTLDTGSGVQ